jgi:hypothetical protein
MRRALLVSALLLSGLAVALVYGVGPDQSTGMVEPRRHESETRPPSAAAQSDVPAAVVAGDRESSPGKAGLPLDVAGAESVRNEVRNEATQEVRRVYPLLFRHLGLTQEESNALATYLIEERIAHTSTFYTRAKPLDEKERAKRITAIIGSPKAQEFLALQRDIRSYAEVAWIGSLLQKNTVPLGDEQRDELFKIVAATKFQAAAATPRTEAKRRSIESLERAIAAQDEYQRHIMEQVPAVLSSKQVQYLFEQYEHLSEKRARALEIQKKRRAENPNDDAPLSYPAK